MGKLVRVVVSREGTGCFFYEKDGRVVVKRGSKGVPWSRVEAEHRARSFAAGVDAPVRIEEEL